MYSDNSINSVFFFSLVRNGLLQYLGKDLKFYESVLYGKLSIIRIKSMVISAHPEKRSFLQHIDKVVLKTFLLATKTFFFFNLVIVRTKQEILLILQSVPRPYLVQSLKIRMP